ncbi:MAG: DUF1538 domain-containing protein, partial [Eubacteriales bacterium]|nr:DUF1538 domain-containing protein [Eubacteriales bacterium]
RKLWVVVSVSFLIGVIITVSEPDLQVLAEQVPSVPNAVLVGAVAVGVGAFLVIALLRILFRIPLRGLLIVSYAVVLVLAASVPGDFLAIAFDSGGVTTGPMTVPFIMALGLGVASIRSDKNAAQDSFGLVALCSIGPILAVLVLGFFYSSPETVVETSVLSFANTAAIGRAYLTAIPVYLKEMAVALSPVVLIFLIFQVCSFRLNRRSFLKICVGILYTYVGLVLFLTGVNVGFSSLGTVLGAELTSGWTYYWLIPLAMLLGWFIISAEPAVYVLEKQIEEVSEGMIPGKAIKLSLSIAIAIAMGLSMLRVLTGISILWFLVPGYALALGLTFFVPDIYTAIAFDSGGVASGPMTATFMLQFMMGASAALGGNVLQDAFGVVALVAMMPLISIQMMGVLYGRRKPAAQPEPEYGDDDIVELWG